MHVAASVSPECIERQISSFKIQTLSISFCCSGPQFSCSAAYSLAGESDICVHSACNFEFGEKRVVPVLYFVVFIPLEYSKAPSASTKLNKKASSRHIFLWRRGYVQTYYKSTITSCQFSASGSTHFWRHRHGLQNTA